MNTKNKHAQALGRLGKGKRKRYSPAEIAKRTQRLRDWRMAHPQPKRDQAGDCDKVIVVLFPFIALGVCLVISWLIKLIEWL